MSAPVDAPAGEARAAAFVAARLGLCVIPPKNDGSKRPDVDSWIQYQQRMPSGDELEAWYGRDRLGVGVVCGQVSGGLEMLEFEGRAVHEGLLEAFEEAAAAVGLGDILEQIQAGYMEMTPSGGFHLLYRCPTPLSNKKLARRPATEAELAENPDDPIKVLIETRGEKGYVVVAPSAGRTHATGKPWLRVRGSFETIATISDEDRDALFALARTFDQTPRPSATATKSPHRLPGGDGPADEFNATVTWQQLLERHGWEHVYQRGDTDHWRRPGARTRGIDATTGHGGDCLYVFSSSTVFDQERPYSKFSAYAILEHGGDEKAAGRALYNDGFGPRRDAATPPTAGDNRDPLDERVTYERLVRQARRIVRDEEIAADADLDAIAIHTGASLLTRQRTEHAELLGELVMVGHNATITGRYKTGKSTLVENVAASLLTGRPFLDRYTPTPRRVAYLNYELDDNDMELRVRRLRLDADALDALLVLNLRGHRLPLTTNAGRDWLIEQLANHQTQVVIIDPFGAAYAQAGGESENDNAEVRRFLTALDEIKRLATCPTLFMPAHTGRGEQIQGDERARGATVLDDWADIRMILTRDEQGARYLRTEGRAHDLNESRLTYHEGRLSLPTNDLGIDRNRARDTQLQQAAIDAIADNPGANSRELRDHFAVAGITRSDDKDRGISLALAANTVHWHPGARNAHHHYLGPPHDDAPCPEGWTPK